MKLLIVVGWKTPNWNTEKAEIIYSGQCGVEAAAAAETARQSGKYAKGAIKRKLITDWVPLPSVPTTAVTATRQASVPPAAVSSPPPQRKAR